MKNISDIGSLKGIGPKSEGLFHKIGIRKIRDLIRYYPRTFEIYEDPVPISDLTEGKVSTISGRAAGRINVSAGKRLSVTTMNLRDATGTIKVIWYRMPFLRSTLSGGGTIVLRGRIIRRKEGLVMEHPDIFYPADKYEEKRNSMQPVYPLTSGLTNNAVIRAVRQALKFTDDSDDILPEELQLRYRFFPYSEAVKNMHFPDSKDRFILARERFVYEEFLIFIVALRWMKEKEKKEKNHFVLNECGQIDELLNKLPYELTGAQKKVWNDIRSDLSGEFVMSRLVQGDVGSGKTILAFLGLILTGLNGYQGALMAPTEVLAKQHFEKFTDLLEKYQIPLQAELLTGSMTEKQKRLARERIASGEVSVIIGTHALIQDKVSYRNLALVVTDEQHRFGVRQREALAGKGNMPHILVMSATPIPRTLAIILYGDLDLSVIDEMPKNRLPIKNCVVDTSYREKAYHFIRSQIKEGRQCYIICPMVEENDTMEAENVTDYAGMLSEELGEDIVVEYLHGKMKADEKDRIMEDFSNNKIQVLVSTTVIEVGIDVPNATVMMIENAERFGLAQLHQLRGRVGRGNYQSYCIFMSASRSKETRKRLEILNHSNDGFYIAGEDLRLRGPGDLFGIRQSGILDFRVADVFQDSLLLQQAADDASVILKDDPGLRLPEHRGLYREICHKINDFSLEKTL